MLQRIQAITILLLLIISISLISCTNELIGYRISVSNPSELSRKSESIALQLSELIDFKGKAISNIKVKDEQGNDIQSQLIDSDEDSIVDYILFQTDFESNETNS